MGESSARLSVVVLFHNLAGMAGDALRSLRWSADPRIDWILIDDASTDETPRMIADAARTLPNARTLLLEENHGAAQARNVGMAAMESDYFTFLDGDDWVAKGYYPALFDDVVRLGLDWVRVDHVECTDRHRLLVRIPDGNRAGRVGSPRDSILPGTRTTSVDFAHTWSGVYHRRLYDEGIFFLPERLRTAEDRPGIWNMHLKVQAFTISDVVGLHYRRGLPTSLTQITDERQLDIVESMRMMAEVAASDPEADRFRPKVLRTWAGLFAWHYANRDRLASPLRNRFIADAAGLLDEAPQGELDQVLAAMPESRRQAVESLRRAAKILPRVLT